MALTDTAIRGAKVKPGSTLKLSDGGGLQLWVVPTGSKLWNIAYRFGGKQLKLSLGAYPAVGLKDAREQREAAKRLLAAGVDPGQQSFREMRTCSSNLSPQRSRRSPRARRCISIRASVALSQDGHSPCGSRR
jgi:hypothetical protein